MRAFDALLLMFAAVLLQDSAFAGTAFNQSTHQPGSIDSFFGRPTLSPMAHSMFCLRYPLDCKVNESASSRAGPGHRRRELSIINTRINRSIVAEVNRNGLAGEVWLLSPRAGDCNDYAVTKRHELLALGWPSSALLLAEVVTNWGKHHLVLVVRDAGTDFVLDSLTEKIHPWSEVPYEWVRIQSRENPKIWSTAWQSSRSNAGSKYKNDIM